MAEGTQLGSAYLNVVPDLSNDAGAKLGKSLGSAMGKAGTSSGTTFGGGILAAAKKYAAPLAAIFSAAAIGKFAKDSVSAFTNLASQTKGLQRVMGGTAESVSGLSGAMKLSGMDADAASSCLTIFSKKLQAASGDADKMAAMNKLLGTSAYDASGAIRPMGEMLPEIANKFAGMQDGAEKTALACQLFGRSGTAMLPFLNKGADGIAELTEKAKELGIVIDDEGISKFGEYKSAMREWNTALEGAKISIGESLIPFLTIGADVLTNVLVPAFQEAAKGISDFFKSVTDAIDFDALMEATGGLGDAIASVFSADNANTAMSFGQVVGNAINGMIPIIQMSEPIIRKLAEAIKWCSENMDIVIPVVGGLVAAFAGMKIVSAISGPLKAIGGAISGIAAKAFSAAAGTSALAAAETAEGAAAGGSVGQTLAMGAAILMIGGGVALAALGMGLLVQSAIALSQTGGAAIPILAGLGIGIVALMGACALLGPTLTAGAVGMLAFGAAVLMVGAGVLLASLGITLICTQLPMLATFGMMAGAALMMMGAGSMILGVGALVAGAGLLVCAVGLAAVAIPLGIIAAIVMVVAAGVMLLGTGMLLCGAGAILAGAGFAMIAAALPSIADSGLAAAASIAALGGAALLAGGGISAGAAALKPMEAACKSIEGALQSTLNKFSEFSTKAKAAILATLSAFIAGCSAMQLSVRTMNLQLPDFKLGKLPHFRLEGKFDMEKNTVPKVAVDWYAKGGVFSSPSIIGVGEAGTEAVLPLNKRTYGEIADGINESAGDSRALEEVCTLLHAILTKIPKGLTEREFNRMAAKAHA